MPTQAVQTLLNCTFDGFDGLEGLLIPPGVGQPAAQGSKLQIQLHAVGARSASTRIGPNGMRGWLCGSVRHELTLSADRPGFHSRILSRFVSVCDTERGRKGCRRHEGGRNVYAGAGKQVWRPVCSRLCGRLGARFRHLRLSLPRIEPNQPSNVLNKVGSGTSARILGAAEKRDSSVIACFVRRAFYGCGKRPTSSALRVTSSICALNSSIHVTRLSSTKKVIR